MKCNAIKSKGEGKRLVKNGGLYVNDVRVENINEIFDMEKHIVDDQFVIVRVVENHNTLFKYRCCD